MTTKEKIRMKTSQPNDNTEESTYALLVRSEDKKRALLETIVYGLVHFERVGCNSTIRGPAH
jgi:hypothetical protein